MSNSEDSEQVNSSDQNLYRDITMGEVVDTNDPQQMGRVRVLCYGMGDDANALMKDIPWATALTPFGGITETTARGRSGSKSTGPIAYGMWNVPKVGSHVLITCIDGDHRFRVWLGCVHPQFMTHTMPHGRYISNKSPFLRGPYTGSEDPIQPITNHQKKSFTPEKQSDIVPGAPSTEEYTKAPEYTSRGADYSVSSVRDEFVPHAESGLVGIGDDNSDDVIPEIDGNDLVHHNGYKESRVVDGIGYKTTDGKNYDPQVYSWTTPGFHTIAMDDSSDNCRMRFRTTHGNQIILDDTNERIYISTPDGKTWVELDEKGSIDVFASRDISFHAEKNINFTCGETFRVSAKKGIHLESDDEIRIHNKGEQGGDFHLKSDTNIRQHSSINTYVESDQQTHVTSGSDIMFQSGSIINITASSTNITSIVSVTGNVSVGGVMHAGIVQTPIAQISAPDQTGGNPSDGQVDITPGIQAPIVTPATPSLPANEKESFLTCRVPEHEPWSRVVTKIESTDGDSGNSHNGAAEFPYNSPKVGRVERGDDLLRNPKWHR